MALDALQPDGKTLGNAAGSGLALPMAGSGAGFLFQNGKTAGDLIPGDAWDAFFGFKNLVYSMDDSPALDVLDNNEIRMFKSLRIILDMCGSMTTEVMRQHVLAHWRASKEGLLKLPIGVQLIPLIKIIDAGMGVR
jgi:hypothetical protein